MNGANGLDRCDRVCQDWDCQNKEEKHKNSIFMEYAATNAAVYASQRVEKRFAPNKSKWGCQNNVSAVI